MTQSELRRLSKIILSKYLTNATHNKTNVNWQSQLAATSCLLAGSRQPVRPGVIVEPPNQNALVCRYRLLYRRIGRMSFVSRLSSCGGPASSFFVEALLPDMDAPVGLAKEPESRRFPRHVPTQPYSLEAGKTTALSGQNAGGKRDRSEEHSYAMSGRKRGLKEMDASRTTEDETVDAVSSASETSENCQKTMYETTSERTGVNQNWPSVWDEKTSGRTVASWPETDETGSSQLKQSLASEALSVWSRNNEWLKDEPKQLEPSDLWHDDWLGLQDNLSPAKSSTLPALATWPRVSSVWSGNRFFGEDGGQEAFHTINPDCFTSPLPGEPSS
ncbi:unnamed protein product, partial [Protopolystoma xenopodis]